jgi:hypothetical protein
MGSLTGRMPSDYSNGPILTPTALPVYFPSPPMLGTLAKMALRPVPEMFAKFAKFAKFANFDPALEYPPLIRCQAPLSERAFLS